VHEVRSFMGMDGYYRIFVVGFSKIANLFTSLINKRTSFLRSKDCDLAFSKLKKLLNSTPMPKVSDMDRPFVVCTNASKAGLGVVLSQVGRVVKYASKKLKPHEKDYATHDFELETIVHSFKVMETLSCGSKF